MACLREMEPAGWLRGRYSGWLFPGCHRLECPAVAVGIFEEDEASPWEHLERRSFHATIGELIAARIGVVDHHLQPLERSGHHLVGVRCECNRARGARRRELDEAQLIADLMVVVSVDPWRVGG